MTAPIPTSRRYQSCRACYGHGVERLTTDDPPWYAQPGKSCQTCAGRGYLELVNPMTNRLIVQGDSVLDAVELGRRGDRANGHPRLASPRTDTTGRS